MTEGQKVAYINAQILCAQAELAGMIAANQERLNEDLSLAYTEENFDALGEKYGLHHNEILSFFME